MEVLLETGDNDYPNHVYVLENGMLKAYWERKNKKLTILGSSILFSKKSRSFRTLSERESAAILFTLSV